MAAKPRTSDHGDRYVQIMFIVFSRDISLILRTREISLHKKNSHDLYIVITHSLVLVIALCMVMLIIDLGRFHCIPLCFLAGLA